MSMILKVLQYNSHGVKKGLGIEHHTKSLGKISRSKAIDVNLSPKVRNLSLRHESFKVLKGVVPKSTSWIMS